MTTTIRTIGSISEQIRGVSYSKSDASDVNLDGYLPVLRAGNITEFGLTFDDLVFVPSSKISNIQKVRKNDIIIAASSGSLSVVGKAARATDDFDGGFGAFCKVLRPKTEVDPSYFAHYFITPEYRRKISSLAAGANINNLRNNDIDDLKIPLPPLPEQKRIAAILDAADALRTQRRQSIAELDLLLQSTFLEMFGDPVENPKGWEVKKLANLGKITTGNTPSRSRPEYYGDDIEWIKSDNINTPSFHITPAEEHLSLEGKKVSRTVPAGSILVTCIAGSPACIGNSALTDREVCFNQQINAFTPNSIVNKWYVFSVFLVGKKLIQMASTNSMKGMVSKSAFSEVYIPVPPFELQDKFAKIAEAIEGQKERLQAHLAELDTLFASLQQRAFNGEL